MKIIFKLTLFCLLAFTFSLSAQEKSKNPLKGLEFRI